MLKYNIKRFLGNTTWIILGGLLTISVIVAFIYLPYNILVLLVSVGVVSAILDILISQRKNINSMNERLYALEYKIKRLEDRV